MELNTFELSTLRKIINIIDIKNIDENIKFDYLRIISLNEGLLKSKPKNILFFPIILGQDLVDNGWIERKTDLQTPINEIINKFPDYTFVVEKNMLKNIKNKKAKLIVVDSIMNSIDLLFQYKIKNNKFKTIAVTGSAGKTTTVGIISQVLSRKYKVLRIYSDRITPIVIKSFIINFLNKSYDIVSLEMSIYYKNHVKELSELLNPDISAMINIGTAHLGNEGLETTEKICKNKAYILKSSEIGFINGDDRELSLLSLKDNCIYYQDEKLFDSKLKKLVYIYPNSTKIVNGGIEIKNKFIKVPILTQLTIIQYLIAYNIAQYLNVKEVDIIDALNSLKPVENRLQRLKIFGKEVIFDGDSSFKERIHQLSKNFYKKSYLVLRKYGADYYKDDFTGISEYFEKFDKIFLFYDLDYLDELKKYPNTEIVYNNDFLKELDGEVFYHYHDYCYTFSKVEEKNLIGK